MPIDDATLAEWEQLCASYGQKPSGVVEALRDAIAEIRRLRELNRIQRIVLDFDPFAENRQLKADLAAHQAVVNAARGVLAGFDEGIWVRTIEYDNDPGWAMKLLPHLQTLAALQNALDPLVQQAREEKV